MLVIDKTFRKPLYYELVIVGFYWNWLGITITKRRPAGRACGVGGERIKWNTFYKSIMDEEFRESSLLSE
jgi:hypothetical protein